MQAFFTQRLGSDKELCTQLEKVKGDLSATQKAIVDEGRLLKEAEEEREIAKTEACEVKVEKDATEVKCKDVEQEKEQLQKELEELRATYATQKKELDEDYHKQVYDMFFFGYQCCMMKNDITQDILSYPSNEEDVAINGPTKRDKDPDAVGPSNGQ